MKRYAILFSYDGSKFYGWQRQVQSPTVQECIENALFRIAKKTVKVVSAGRTDTGVHALGQVAHFDIDLCIPPHKFVLALNSYLGHFIKVIDLVEVSNDFHARYDAILRVYKYIITLNRTPFNYHYKSYFPRYLIDIEKFQGCIDYFLGEQDFTSFSKPNPDVTNHVCDVKKLTIDLIDDDIVIEITANRFLHHMVRRVIGALLSVSHKSLDPSIIKNWIENKKHNQRNYSTATPNGLYLSKIIYPHEKVIFSAKVMELK